MTLTDTEPVQLPTREELLAEFGEADLSVLSLFRFCFVPVGRLGLLKSLTREEDWGAGDTVLLKYLAVHVRLSIEQGRYSFNDEQIVLTAGNLRTQAGVPIYVGLVRNHTSTENPWAMNWVGERPSCSPVPEPPCLGEWDSLDPASEIVLGVDLEDSERLERVPELANAPADLSTAALVGACHWALHRGLATEHRHSGVRSYFLPLYLRSRADLCAAPDLVASAEVQAGRLLIRFVLDPEIAYAPARAVVDRCDLLPAWLRESWRAKSSTEGED